MTIRWKLGIIFLVILLVPLTIFAVVGVYNTRHILKHEIGQNFALIANEKAMEVASTLDRRVKEAVSLASDPRVIAAVMDSNSSYAGKDNNFAVQEIGSIDRVWIKSKGDTPEARSILGNDVSVFFRNYQGRDPLEYGEIFITDRLGATVAMTSMLTDYYQADEGWWQEGFDDGKGAIYIDDRGRDLSVNAIVTGVIVPIRVSGDTVGLLKVNFKMAHIPAIISNPYEGGDVRVFMLRSNNTAVIDPSNGLHETATVTKAQVMVERLKGGWSVDEHDLDPTIMGYAHVQPKKAIYSRFQKKKSMKGVSGESWGKTDWYVFVERSRAMAYEPLTELMLAFIVGGVVMVVVIISMAGVTATTITNPLLQLRERMEIIARGDLDFMISSDRKDEFGDVLRGIDWMAGRLKKSLASRDELNQEIDVRKKTETALRDANVEADKANKAKSEFLASMSHELRTPLNAVLGFAQMLQFDPKNPLSPNQNVHVESILEGGNHLLELVNEVLDLAKIEAGQLDFSLNSVNANEVVEDCIALMFPLGEPRGIKIVDQFSSGPSIHLRTDQRRLKQALINILANAVKYNKNGGTVTVEGRKTEHGFLHLSVTDTGVGIAEEDCSNVFHMFHRLGMDPMVAQEGTGIGLTVTKLLVERMAGQVGFESEEGIGSTFWVELPLTSNEEVLIWANNMRIGIDAIDNDHQVLISLLNKITNRAVDDAILVDVIEELINYTHHHFRREEKIMEICGYPGLKEHIKHHRNLSAQVSDLADTWRKGRNPDAIHHLRKFLRTWLSGHIMNEDTAIIPFTYGKDQDIRKALVGLEWASETNLTSANWSDQHAS